MIKTLFHIVIILCILFISFGTAGRANAASLPFSLALYYASNHPLDELKAFDVAVVDPNSGISPTSYGVGKSELFAYVSLGEADPKRSYAKLMDPAWFISTNKVWDTNIIDTSNPEWRTYFIDKIVAPMWADGYRGFFVDTLDSYKMAASREDFSRMEEGIADTLREVRRRFPGVRLILNRGFDVFGRLKGEVFAVAAESLFQRYDPVEKAYVEVPENDREWLLTRFREVRDAGVPVIAIDYVPPEKRALARQTAERIKNLGIIPWVADKDLASLGVGAVEVMPRVVLGLYDGAEGNGDAFFTNLQRYAVMPLNYLGYTIQMHDLREPLPAGILAGRYAGVVIWPNSSSSGEMSDLKKWTRQRMAEGVPVVFLERFGVSLDGSFLSLLGLELIPAARAVPPVRVVLKDSSFDFEQQPLPNVDTFVPLKLKQGTPLLRMASANGIVSDVAAITPWGGYIFGPYVISQLLDDRTAWVVDPFRFFKDALRLPDMPVPDTTTENGVRLLMSHVDGDGFESRAEWPGGRLAAEELRTNILERYRIPTTISLITSSFAPNGINPDKAPQLEKIARGIFALANVEGASHSFSHPFRWKPDQTDTGTQVWPTVNIPGYSFSLGAEIVDSLDYINRNLMPPGKRARIFQWTGNCVPGEDAVKMTYEAVALNINGGDTLITESNRSISNVAPLGIPRGEYFQVFAPNQNENVYTNLWTEKFYGYRRVLETFRLTDLPRRLKPVDIYYHFYSATKEASLNALRQVHDWATGQRLFGIYTSDYIEKVLDFNRTVIARDGSGWLVRNSGKLRELRIPGNLGYPDLDESSNVAGFNDHGNSRYLHLVAGGEARFQLQAAAPAIPYLISAGGYLESLERGAHGIKLLFNSHTPFTVRLGNASGCRFVKDADVARTGALNELAVELAEGNHALAIDCR